MRILALDWGDVRIGAAVSDPEGKIAFPADHFIETPKALTEIKKLVDQLNVEKIVIGLPTGLNGQDTKSTEKVKGFIETLKENFATSIEVLDERFSSVAAGKTLSAMGISEKEQRGLKDNIAAQLMLQQYLDTKNNN